MEICIVSDRLVSHLYICEVTTRVKQMRVESDIMAPLHPKGLPSLNDVDNSLNWQPPL